MTANHRLHDRWGTWMIGSTIASVAAHAMLFVLWPAWEVPAANPADPRGEMVQLIPVPDVRGVEAGEEASSPALQVLDDPAPEEAPESDRPADALAEVPGDRHPLDRGQPIPMVMVPRESHTSEVARLNVALVAPVRPTVTPASLGFVWPELRNAGVIRQYLRSAYDSLPVDPNAADEVRVALWLDEHGSVQHVDVARSSGLQALDDLAVELFQSVATFTPGRNGRFAVPVHITIDVPFRIPW